MVIWTNFSGFSFGDSLVGIGKGPPKLKGTSTNKDIDPIVNEDRAGHPRFFVVVSP